MTSEMSDDDVADEIRTIFTKQMNNNHLLPSPERLASGQSGIIYILALDKLSIEKVQCSPVCVP